MVALYSSSFHETRNISINNLTLHLKQLEKEEKNPKVSRREEIKIIKIRSEISEKEMKEMIAKIKKK